MSHPCFCILIFAVLSLSAAGEDWPAWRGVRGDAKSLDNNWNKNWEKDEPAILWEDQIGTGYGSIAVRDKRLFVMGHRGGEDSLYCFDALSGKSIWAQSYRASLMDNLHEGGPGSTPYVTDTLVYTVSRQGKLFARDVISGAIAWQKFYPDDFGVSPPEWGFTASVIGKGNRVYFDAGRTVAADSRTGNIIWQSRPYLPGYGAPALFAYQGKDYLAVLNNTGLVVFEAESGREVDSYTWKTQYDTNATTPIISGDKIFISTAYNKGCALLQFDGTRVKPIYQNRNMRNHMNTSVLDEGMLYGFDRKQHNRRLVNLVGLDLETGEVRWKNNEFGCGTLFKAGDTYLVLSDQGLLVSARLSPQGFEERSRKQVLEGQCWTMPIMANSILYARNTAGRLVAVDLRK
jgi:outer membrane protein assembly factor BamB